MRQFYRHHQLPNYGNFELQLFQFYISTTQITVLRKLNAASPKNNSNKFIKWSHSGPKKSTTVANNYIESKYGPKSQVKFILCSTDKDYNK